MRAQRITDTIAYHAEGPCWWEATGRLRFVDMLAGTVIELDDAADSGHRRLPVGSPVAAVIRPRVDGGAIVATERGISLSRREDLSDLTPAAELFADPAVRTNEGGCDPDGRFWIGTMPYAKTPGGATMYRWDGPGSEPLTAWGGATICNGLGFSPDGGTAYWTDTPTGTVVAMEYRPTGADRGGLTDPRPLVSIDPVDGHPDGLCVDADGGVWVALNGGAAVRRYTADGALDAVVELPVRQVTACAFGGADYTTLYITTSRENLPDDVEPAAGSIFAAEPGVKGLAPLPFRS
ncbi:SMP-30/gluconolactonase/LRE family protein [Actinomyces sp.]|uniref:SMP-30/gluconolactonase/LRE family protein n=1 Tax=Actinomyces sp. TaxID=29317 RepID=UPI0026DBF446|nr:SMP-30/gluconolactonase/LRE family protein [Actinomyces sp.]MDO4901806.1 SMP-30/gluconolactonase/LRE family protein [Actinomyces sp.]